MDLVGMKSLYDTPSFGSVFFLMPNLSPWQEGKATLERGDCTS